MKIKLIICSSLSYLFSGCALMNALNLPLSSENKINNEVIISEKNMKLEAMCFDATKNIDRANKKYRGTLASAQGIFSFADMRGVGKRTSAVDYDRQDFVNKNQSKLYGPNAYKPFYNPFYSVYINFETSKYVISYQMGKDDDYYLQFDEGQLVTTEERLIKAVFADTNNKKVTRYKFGNKIPCYIITEPAKKTNNKRKKK